MICCSSFPGYYSGLTVAAGVTLTVPAGTVVKTGNTGIKVAGGSLVAQGTSDAPVVFTSFWDSSAGTVAFTDHAPAPGDWSGITLSSPTSGASLDNVSLRYASTALSVADGAQATVHGSILSSTMGVSAAGSDFIDATHVDWGDPSGPAPIGTGTPIQGDGVLVTPWIGFVAPAQPAPQPPATDPTPSCAAIFFLGVRGSGEPPQSHNPYSTDETQNIGAKVLDVLNGFNDELDSWGSTHGGAPTVEVLGLRYPADGANVLNMLTGPFFYSFWAGVYQLEQSLATEEQLCPNQKIVLSGYSQGALVIHLALADLDLVGSPLISTDKIAAVVLVSDPAKLSNGDEVKTGSASPSAPGIYAVLGVYTPPIPGTLTGRTISMCTDHDIVCAPGFGASWYVHGGYDASLLGPLGHWAADTLLSE